MKADELEQLTVGLKKLDVSRLSSLCKDIRAFLLESLNETGGHFASNFGVVELTVALHYCFNLPSDKIVWDVSHQSYVHKILSGRIGGFKKLRQGGGISGFSSHLESNYDQFITGHAGTSIANGLGIELANRMAGKSDKVICVVGDASLQAGANLEALNYVGHVPNNLIIVLNDNGMSISEPIGSIMEYLGGLLARKAGKILKNIPSCLRTKNLFEHLNISYLGPINGHNISHLVSVFNDLKNENKARLIHIKTKKGLGYAPAVKDPTSYHKVSKGFLIADRNRGKKAVREKPKQFTEVFGECLAELAEGDKSIVAISAAMLDGTGLAKFAKKFPDRCFDVGICEQAGVSMAAGLARASMKPVVAIYSTFLQRAYDQVFHDVCLNRLPVVFALDRAGVVGEDGPTHNGAFDISYLRHLPHMTLMSPRCGAELKEMLKFALGLNGPAAIRYPVDAADDKDIKIKVPEILLGKPEVLASGEDVAFFGYGNMVVECLRASLLLKERGVSSTVVNARFAKPIDCQFVNEIVKNHKIVISVEDHAICGGFGSAIREVIPEKSTTPFYILGYPDKFISHGDRREILKNCRITGQALVNFVEEVMPLPKITKASEASKELVVAKTAGFCMGVERALRSTLKIAKENKNNGNKPIYTLGPLIHNKHVIKFLEDKEIHTVSSIDDINDGIVVIRAHGVGPETLDSIKRHNLNICDATCPKVKKVQMIVDRHAKQGYSIVIFGDKTHAEVVGLLGYAGGKSYVISDASEVDTLPDDLMKVCLVSQTTQNLMEYNRIKKRLDAKFPKAKAFDTICDSTSKRQEEVRNMSSKVDAVVVIGDKNSGNTTRLVQISQATGSKTYHVENPSEITEEEFSKFDRVGITAGASTPMWIVDGVVKKLKEITNPVVIS